MAYLLKGPSIVSLHPAAIERSDLRIEAGRVVDRGPWMAVRDDDEVIDLDGRLVLPGMVCAHTHLYSALARGMPAPPRAPVSFREILELVWWKLDRALDEETIYWGALAGALDAARSGTTCLYDHHASPSRIRGSLAIIREAVEKAGLRAVLCYEVTDRGGPGQRDEGIEENRAFLSWVRAGTRQFRGLVGAHASFTLTDASLQGCAELARAYGTGIHIHVAEDLCDVEDARAKYGTGIMERLIRLRALNEHAIVAHGTHLRKDEVDEGRAAGAWFAHNPRSNMNNRVGCAPVADFGERMLLGTDGIGADMFEEAGFAFYRSREAGLDIGADRWLEALAGNQKRASIDFGVDLARLTVGAEADLVILDYPCPTPLTAENLAWHFIFGMNSSHVESVMAGGMFVIRDRTPASDATVIYGRAREAARKLWDKMQRL